MSPSSRDVDVLVVGAGIAGVTTAWALRQAGISSIVLEAQDRIGGRICTSRKWKKLPVDMGAGWVSHPTINPLVELARKKKIKLTPSDLGKLSITEANGHSFSRDETDALFGVFGLVYAKVKLAAGKRRSAGQRDIALSKVIPGILDEMELDTETRRGVEFLINLTITEAYAADLNDLSLYNWDENYTQAFLSLFVVPDGYGRIVEALTKGLDIRKEHVVTEIAHDEGGVCITTRNHGEFRAPYAVIAVPHGVLAKGNLKFTQQLPAWKREAIARIHTGVSDKFWFLFPHKFWKSNKQLLGRVDPDGKGRWSTWVNFHKYTGEPLLVVFNRTAHAVKLEKMSDDAVVAEAMGVLRAEFKRKIPEPLDMQRSKWGANEFALGSISHLPPLGTNEDFRALGRPVGRLRFAGDSTCAEFNLQVIGAFWSGIREAERLTGDLLFSG